MAAAIIIAAAITIVAVITIEASAAVLRPEARSTALLYVIYIPTIKIVCLFSADIFFLKKLLGDYIINA
jgi:hypothetical protein